MPALLYDLYITGKLVEGVSPETARNDLAALFNTSADKVARYVTGQAAVFKRGIDKTEAMKYKGALHRVGILVAFKSHQREAESIATKPAEGSSAKPVKVPSTNTTPDSADSSASSAADNDNPLRHNTAAMALSLAAVGSDVLTPEEKSHFVAANIDTSAIHMVSVFAEPEAPAPVAAVSPDTSHMSIAEAGAQLLVDKPEPPPPLPLNLDSISLAPTGASLDQLKENVSPLQPNTDGLNIAPVGADLLEGEQQPTPPATPDTSHLSLSAER